MKKPSVRERLKYYQRKFQESQQNGRQVLMLLLTVLDNADDHEIALSQQAIDHADQGPSGFVMEPRVGHPDGGYVVRATYDTPAETPGTTGAVTPACDPNPITGDSAITPKRPSTSDEACSPVVTPSDSLSPTGANDAA